MMTSPYRNRVDRLEGGRSFALVAELGSQLAPREPVELRAVDLDVVQLRQPLDDVQRLPGDRRAAEIELLQAAEDAELADGGVGNIAAGQVEPLQFQELFVVADEIVDELVAVGGVVEPDAEDRFGELGEIAERFLQPVERSRFRPRRRTL